MISLFDYDVHVSVRAISSERRSIALTSTTFIDETTNPDIIHVEVLIEEPQGWLSFSREEISWFISAKLQLSHMSSRMHLFAPSIEKSEPCIPLFQKLGCTVDLHAVDEDICEQFFGYDHIRRLIFDEEWMQLEYERPSIQCQLSSSSLYAPLHLDPEKLRPEWVEFDINLGCETGSFWVTELLVEAQHWARLTTVPIRVIIRGRDRVGQELDESHADAFLGIGRIDELVIKTDDGFRQMIRGVGSDWRGLSVGKCVVIPSSIPSY